MVNNGLTPDSMSGNDFNPYAETEYEYYTSGADANRVHKMYTHGQSYLHVFTYTAQSQSSTSLNVWTRKTEVVMPDNSTVRYYFNRGGQVILHQVDSNGSPNKTWNVLYQKFQENTGRLLLDADAPAIYNVDEGTPGLVTLEEGAGRIRTYTYHSSGNLNEECVQEGTLGSVHVKSARTYTYRSATGALGGLWVPASVTIYSDTGLGGAATTSYAYSWHGTSLQMSQCVTTYPVVPTGQNGTGAATTRTENFNAAGYLTSVVDEEGNTTQYTFDAVKGGMTQKIIDPGSSPHLNLITDYTLDNLGRTTLTLGPAHDIDLNGAPTNIRRAQWTQFLDAAGEMRSFAGYRKTTGSVDQIVGPVTVVIPNAPRGGIGANGDRRAETYDAVYSSAGIPAPTVTFARSAYVRWTIELYSQGNKLKEEWSYFVIPASGTGSQSTNYGKRLFAYDSAGRLNQTTCAGGTIDKTTFNAMGWAEKEEIGTSAGLTTTETKEYYDTGTLKKRTLPVDGDTDHDRVWDYTYDYRQRLLEEQSTVEVYIGGTWILLTRYEYDNRELQTAVTKYHTSVTAGNRTARATAAYDPLGRLYRQQRYAVSSSGVLGNALTDNLYYNKTGQVAREERAGSALAVATKFDAAGRPTERFWATGTFSTSDPASVTNATVVEQEATVWDKGSNPISTVRKQRFDGATGTGELKDKNNQPKARIYYKELYFDGIGRELAVVDYGTNGGSSVSRANTIPPRSDTVLVTTTAYSSAGNVATKIDPAGIADSQTWDAADRLITVTENAWTASSSSSSSSSGFATDVRTTRFEYTDDGWLKKLKSENAATGQQVTEWVYGVTPTGSPPDDQGLYSNRLVREKIYPTTGAGSSTVQYAYNRQKQVRTFTDQISTAHEYSYDKLGRLIMDAVTAFGSGINDTIEKLVWGYDNRGRLVRAASLEKTTEDVLNEVYREFNDFNQVTYEHQEHNGEADIGVSPKVGYSWANGSSNTIRQTGFTYPNAGTFDIDYGSGLDSSLNRPLALKESSTTFASMRYLGLGVQVGLKYDAASATQPTYLTYENGGTGDAGDIYTGLDRFGRLVETLWKTGSTKQIESQYGRNRVGGVVWKKDLKASTAQDHYYWYDRLQQVRQHQRGTLTPGSPPYTGITSLQQTEVLTFDETGNWLSYSATSPSSVTQYRTHNKANWITALTGSPDGVDPVYANTGNMTTMPKVGAWTTAQTLVWDAWNRLVKVQQTIGGTLTDITVNTYDGFHRRTRKVGGGETRDYYYDFNWRSVEERVGTAGSQTVKAQYTWSPADRWTMIRRKRSKDGGTLNEVLYVLKDYLDPAALLDPGSPNATVVERFGFDAFGPVRFTDGAFGSIGSSAYDWNFLFHAEFMDQESGLYNYGYRYYQVNLGRWMSRDPIEELGGYNLYMLVNNDSVNLRDLWGSACVVGTKKDCVVEGPERVFGGETDREYLEGVKVPVAIITGILATNVTGTPALPGGKPIDYGMDAAVTAIGNVQTRNLPNAAEAAKALPLIAREGLLLRRNRMELEGYRLRFTVKYKECVCTWWWGTKWVDKEDTYETEQRKVWGVADTDAAKSAAKKKHCP
jgi:RHS repeat-associated protein